jgi:Domain of unknown function (DUF4390)
MIRERKKLFQGPVLALPVLMSLLAAVACFTGDAPAYAAEEAIARLTATVINPGEVAVSAQLIRWYNPTLQEDLNNGIPKDLYYYILLKKRQPAWFDEEIVSKTIKQTIKYDVLKKQYSITTREDGQTTEKTVESFEEMSDLISRIDRVKIITQKRMKARQTYYISVKAEMRATNVPFYLEYILFFIPALELDTPWADSAPFYTVE